MTTDSSPLGPEPRDRAQFKVGNLYPVIPGRLSFAVHRDEAHTAAAIRESPRLFYFSSHEHEAYRSYCDEKGPTDLLGVVSFCTKVKEMMGHPLLKNRELVFYSGLDAGHRTNAAFLLGAYLVMDLGFSPDAAATLFENFHRSPFSLFRDACLLPPTLELTIRDCLQGLFRAFRCGWVKSSSESYIDLDELYVSRVCHAAVVCRTPSSNPEHRHMTLEPEALAPVLARARVSDVVGFRETSAEDRAVYEAAGMRVHDLATFCESTPDEATVQFFLSIMRSAGGAVAVHCMTGLTRAPTLVGAWLVREEGWSAREAIAWLRIVRPGSVVAEQQHFLEAQERLGGG
jgi:cell division cycle 14